VARRVAGLPLEQLLGWAEFAGRRFAVRPGVFVPRQRSVLMAEQALLVAPPNALVLDLCCGVGAIGMTIALARADVSLVCADIDPAAIEAARENVGQHGRVFAGDLFDALPADLRGRVDILVCNAPYVPSEAIRDMPPEARDHEHRIALDGGEDGLDVHRQVAQHALEWLSPGGSVFVEASEAQAPYSAGLFERAGLAASIEHSDELYATVVRAVAPQ
jgi:release factor glutamine methyltransferase